ncbi:uncharacterized protein I303_102652 [Kwoniella dejecticola CBS 10117]|uniref:Aldose reductase n=1 Tax=Kwoniella dejecticola CBS 10117 TaxID=1296121 RepID=A0A1A6A9C3_9TREE|nr:aldose reductase [Kwoniella dejecticola CBS 10117]OBR86656.1 aldose reductase [Kwoniella dejecticola CBS 10117]
MSAQIPTLTLNDGTKIPRIGYGLGTANYGSECAQHVVSALKTGYNYIDCAQMYGNSKSFGEGFAKFGGKREDVYIVQKVGKSGTESHPRKVLETLLKDMNTDYVDLYLLHSPLLLKPLSLSEAWKVMEELKEEGLARSIGVSNFREEDILEIEKTWKMPPSVNQIEYHPYNFHAPNVQRLLAIQKKHNIHVEAYGPLTSLTGAKNGPVDDVVEAIAKSKGIEESQVLLNWARQTTDGVVVTTSTNEERQKIQLEAITKNINLTQEELDQISEAGRKKFFRYRMTDVWDAAKP